MLDYKILTKEEDHCLNLVVHISTPANLYAEDVELYIKLEDIVVMNSRKSAHPVKCCGQTCIFELGDMEAGEARTVRMRLLVIGLNILGAVKVAEMKITYTEADDPIPFPEFIIQEIFAHSDEEGMVIPRELSIEFMRIMALTLVYGTLHTAIHKARQGDAQGALKEISAGLNLIRKIPCSREVHVRQQLEALYRLRKCLQQPGFRPRWEHMPWEEYDEVKSQLEQVKWEMVCEKEKNMKIPARQT